MLREIKSRWLHAYVDKKNRYQGEYTEWFGDGRLLRQTSYLDDRLHGEYKEWWGNGQISVNCFYVNGIRHGEYKDWYGNGRYNQRCFFVNGKLHGEYISYYKSSGNVKAHYFYIDDIKTSSTILPIPTTPEERMLFVLKYNIPLLPVEQTC